MATPIKPLVGLAIAFAGCAMMIFGKDDAPPTAPEKTRTTRGKIKGPIKKDVDGPSEIE